MLAFTDQATLVCESISLVMTFSEVQHLVLSSDAIVLDRTAEFCLQLGEEADNSEFSLILPFPTLIVHPRLAELHVSSSPSPSPPHTRMCVTLTLTPSHSHVCVSCVLLTFHVESAKDAARRATLTEEDMVRTEQ